MKQPISALQKLTRPAMHKKYYFGSKSMGSADFDPFAAEKYLGNGLSAVKTSLQSGNVW
nr:hypothetical protein [uncultured Butyricicoccus sp.]